jgi:hypothetical protein
LKSEPHVRFINAARPRAVLVVGIMLIAAFAVDLQITALAADESPSAAPAQLFGVHPVQEGRTTLPGGHFNFALVAGQRIADGIVVENFSDHALRFDVYGADLLTASGGGLAPAQPSATMHEVGAWITVSVPVVAVAAHAQVTDGFTVRVPVAASSGQHLGAIVAAADIGVTPQGTPIQARAALIVVVTVPGAADASAGLTALRGSDATPGQVGFTLTLSNTGNVLLTFAGVVTIEDAQGQRVATLPLTPSDTYVVPNGRVPLAAVWTEPAPLADMYRAEASVTVFANGKLVRTITSQTLALRLASGVPAYVPLTLGLAIGALIALAFWIARSLVGRRLTRAAPRVRRTGSVA